MVKCNNDNVGIWSDTLISMLNNFFLKIHIHAQGPGARYAVFGKTGIHLD